MKNEVGVARKCEGKEREGRGNNRGLWSGSKGVLKIEADIGPLEEAEKELGWEVEAGKLL